MDINSNNIYYSINIPLYKLQDKNFENIFYDIIDNLVKFALKNLNDENKKNYYIVGGKALEIHLLKKIYDYNNYVKSFDFDIHIRDDKYIEGFIKNFLNILNSAINNPQFIISLIIKLKKYYYSLYNNEINLYNLENIFEFICCKREINVVNNKILNVYSIMLKINNEQMTTYYIHKNNNDIKKFLIFENVYIGNFFYPISDIVIEDIKDNIEEKIVIFDFDKLYILDNNIKYANYYVLIYNYLNVILENLNINFDIKVNKYLLKLNLINNNINRINYNELNLNNYIDIQEKITQLINNKIKQISLFIKLDFNFNDIITKLNLNYNNNIMRSLNNKILYSIDCNKKFYYNKKELCKKYKDIHKAEYDNYFINIYISQLFIIINTFLQISSFITKNKDLNDKRIIYEIFKHLFNCCLGIGNNVINQILLEIYNYYNNIIDYNLNYYQNDDEKEIQIKYIEAFKNEINEYKIFYTNLINKKNYNKFNIIYELFNNDDDFDNKINFIYKLLKNLNNCINFEVLNIMTNKIKDTEGNTNEKNLIKIFELDEKENSNIFVYKFLNYYVFNRYRKNEQDNESMFEIKKNDILIIENYFSTTINPHMNFMNFKNFNIFENCVFKIKLNNSFKKCILINPDEYELMFDIGLKLKVTKKYFSIISLLDDNNNRYERDILVYDMDIITNIEQSKMDIEENIQNGGTYNIIKLYDHIIEIPYNYIDLNSINKLFDYYILLSNNKIIKTLKISDDIIYKNIRNNFINNFKNNFKNNKKDILQYNKNNYLNNLNNYNLIPVGGDNLYINKYKKYKLKYLSLKNNKK